MPSVQIALLAALSASTVSAISFIITCDSNRNPQWSDCQAAFDGITNTLDDNNGNYPIQQGTGANCVAVSSGNCAVTICDDLNQGYVAGNLIVDAVNNIQTDCEYVPSGGNAGNTDGSMSLSIYADETNPTKRSIGRFDHRALAKRDNTWTTAYRIDNAAPDQWKQQVLSSQPGGSSWTLTNEESQTNMVQASVSISEDLFSIFSATESISYSYSETVTTSSSQTILNNCGDGQSGTLYWYPLFTQYHGGYSDGPSPADIYIPITESDGSAAGKYTVTCAG